MPGGDGLAVIAHGDRQEMVLDVGVIHPRLRPDEGAAFELVRGPDTPPGQQPLRADPGLAPTGSSICTASPAGWRRTACRFPDGPAGSPPRPDGRPPPRSRVRADAPPADARQHQKLGRVDRRGREDHLAPGADDLDLGRRARPRPRRRAAVLDHDAPGKPRTTCAAVASSPVSDRHWPPTSAGPSRSSPPSGRKPSCCSPL
jgi:hypothetical protein